MGNKANKQTSSYGFLKPTVRGIHKKTYGSSRVGKKAKEMVKKNLSLFLKGINLQQMINYSTTNDPSSSSSSTKAIAAPTFSQISALKATKISWQQTRLMMSKVIKPYRRRLIKNSLFTLRNPGNT